MNEGLCLPDFDAEDLVAALHSKVSSDGSKCRGTSALLGVSTQGNGKSARRVEIVSSPVCADGGI